MLLQTDKRMSGKSNIIYEVYLRREVTVHQGLRTSPMQSQASRTSVIPHIVYT